MSSTNTKVYVRNIPAGLTQRGLVNLFSSCGTVQDANFIKPKQQPMQDSGRPAGQCAIVEFEQEDEAELAVQSLNTLCIGDHQAIRVRAMLSNQQRAAMTRLRDAFEKRMMAIADSGNFDDKIEKQQQPNKK